MDQSEERKKKLEAAKEKLAAFQKKKKSKAKAAFSINDGKDENSHQNGNDLSPSEVSSPSALSVTDSDQFSFTSGDEWSTEESDQKYPVPCQPNLTDVRQECEESTEAASNPDIPPSDADKEINISDVEFALAKRDELINKLTQSLQSSLGQNIPNVDVMSQVHTLAEHILTLHSQLQQADQSLQEQLELHESSALALQSAKEQILQLQVIINYKDAELKRMFQMFENNTQVIHCLQTKEVHTEKSLTEVYITCNQYVDKIKTLEGELQKRMLDAETFTSSRQEWIAREHELLSLLSAKSEEVNALLVSHQVLTFEEQAQKETNSTEQELLKDLASQLEQLRRENESGTNEISMLRKINIELEAEKSDFTRHLSNCQSWNKEYEALLHQHSQSISQIEYLTLLNSDLQDKLSSLSSVEKDFAELSSEYKKLHMSYQDEIHNKFQYSESDSYAELSATFSKEKELLNTKIIELQNEIAQFQVTSKRVGNSDVVENENNLDLNAQHSVEREALNTNILELQTEIAKLQTVSKSSVDDVDAHHSLVAQLQQQLLQKDDYLNEKLYEIAEMQVMLHGLRCSYERVENTLVSNEEVIASLTERLQKSDHTNKSTDLEEAVSQKLKLEHTVTDLQHRLQEKGVECRQYTENIVKLQDELLSCQHANRMEMSQKEHQLESIEEHMLVLNSERAKLVERVKDLEHRLQIECQQYMDAVQHVMVEKERECKQYTENIVALQDELLSLRHAHCVEMSGKEYQCERIEEQMEMLGTDRANLAQKVKDLELRLNLAYQQSQENVNNEIDHECTNYTEKNVVMPQDELTSTEHVHGLQMLKNKRHFEHSEKQMVGLEEQREIMPEKLSALEQELSVETELSKEMQEKKLQDVIADREGLLKTVESLTAEIQFLKKELHDTNVENKPNYEYYDWNSKHCISNDETENIGDRETESVKIMTTDVHSKTHEIHDISYSENTDIAQKYDEPLSQVQDIIARLEYQQQMAIHHQAETEQLKVKISVINMNEDLRQTQTVLQALAAELVKAQSEFTKHTQSFLKRLKHFEIYEQEARCLQEELLEIQAVPKHMPEKEAGQEELQAQLEITISQWQRLQFIVQEKEIELHKLQESLDEQKRICASMMKTHEEQRCLFQAEIDSLRSAPEQHNPNAIEVENKLFDLQTNLENKSYETHQTKSLVYTEQVATTDLHDCLNQKEIEISNLKTLLSMKQHENSQQENSLNVLQKIIADLKISLSESQFQVTSTEEKLQHRESEVEILKGSLYGSIEEKELELINFRTSVDSQVKDLMAIITDRESEVNSLRLDNTEKVLEITNLKKMAEDKSLEIDVVKGFLADRDSEVNSLKNCLTDTDSEMYSLKSYISDHDEEVFTLKTIVSAKESEIAVLKSSLSDKEADNVVLRSSLADLEMEKDELQKTLFSSESEVNDLKFSLTAMASEVDALKESLGNKEFDIGVLRKSQKDNESEINVLRSNLTRIESEIDAAKSNVINRETTIDTLNKSLQDKDIEISELTSSLRNIEAEINDSNSGFANRESEIDELKSSLTNKESEIGELKSSLTNKESEIDELKSSLTEKKSEIDELKSSLTNKESEIDELKSSLTEKKSEIDELKSSLTDKESEIGELKSSLTNKESEIDELKSSLTDKESENGELKNSLINKESEIDELKSSLTNKESEVDELKSSLTNKESEIGDVKNSLTDTEFEIDELKSRLTNKESISDQLNNSLTNKESEIGGVKSSLKDKVSEIDELKSSLTNKESEIGELKSSLTNKESEIGELKSSVTNKESEIGELKSSLTDKESEIGELKSSLTNKESEIDELKSSLTDKESEIGELKSSLTDKESEIGELKSSLTNKESEIDELKSSLTDKKSEIGELKSSLTVKESENGELKSSLTNKESEIDELKSSLTEKKSETDELKSSLTDKKSEIDVLGANLADREAEVISVRSSFAGVQSEIQVWRSYLAEKYSDVTIPLDEFVHGNYLKRSGTGSEGGFSVLKSSHAKDEHGTFTLNDIPPNRQVENTNMLNDNSAVDNKSEIDPLMICHGDRETDVDEREKGDAENTLDVATLRDNLIDKESVINELKTTLSSKEVEINGLENENADIKLRIELLESKFSDRDSELENVILALKEKELEIHDLRENLINIEMTLQSFRLGNEEKDSELEIRNNQLKEMQFDISTLQIECAKKDSDILNIKDSLVEKESEIGNLKLTISLKDKEIELEKNDISERDVEIADLRNELLRAQSVVGDFEKDITFKDTEIEMLVTNLADRASEVDSLKSTLLVKELTRNTVTNNLNERDLTIVSLLSRVEERETETTSIRSILAAKDLELTDTKSSLANKESELVETKSLLAELELESNILQSSLTERDAEVRDLQLRISEKETEVVYFKNSFTNRDSEITDVKSSFEEKESEVNDLKSKVNETLSEMEKLQGKLNEREEELSLAVQSKIEIHAELDKIKLQIEEDGTDAKRDFSEKNSEINALKERLTDSESQVDLLHTKLWNMEEQLLVVKNSVMMKESEISDLTDRLNETVSRLDELQIIAANKDRELTAVRENIVEKECMISIMAEELLEASCNVDRLNTIVTNTNRELSVVKGCVLEKEAEICSKASHINEKLLAATNTIAEKDLEISRMTGSLKEAISQVDLLHISLNDANVELRAVKNNVVEKESEISSLTEKLDNVSSQVEAVHASLSSAKEELKGVQDSLVEKESKVCAIEQDLISANSQVEVLDASLTSANEELRDVKSSLLNKDEEICALKVRLDEVSKKECEISLLTDTLDNTTGQVERLNATIIHTNEELIVVKTTVVEKDSKISVLNEELSSAKDQIETLSASVCSTSEELTAVKTTVVEKDSKISVLIEELSNAKDQIETLSASVCSTNEELTAVKITVVENEFEICTLNERINESSSQILSLKSILEDTANELTVLKHREVEKESEIRDLSQRFSEARSELDALHTTLNNTSEELKTVASSLMNKESDCIVLVDKVNGLCSQNEILQSTLNEREELFQSVTSDKNVLQTQLHTLQNHIQTLKVNLCEVRAENDDMKHSLHNNQEHNDHMQGTIIDKESQLTSLAIHVTDLQQEIQKLSGDIEMAKTVEEQLTMDFESKEQKFELTREKYLQDLENMTQSLAEKESTIAELMQSVVNITTIKNQLLEELSTAERSHHILNVSLSNLMQADQAKCDIIVHQELQLQEQAEQVLVLTDSLAMNGVKLEEIQELNKSLQELNDELIFKSHVHLDESAHLREAIEQQVREMEDILAQKEREISALMQSVSNETINSGQLARQLLVVETKYRTLLGFSSHLQEDILVKEATLFDQKVFIDDQSMRLNDLAQELTQSALSMNDLNASLKSEVAVLQECKCELEQRVSNLQNELDNQEIAITQLVVEGKHTNEKLTSLTHDLEAKEATIFDLRHDYDMFLKEINDLKQELEQKDLLNISLKEEVESVHGSLERSKEEKEMLKANFDSCMEEMQQRFGDQEIEMKTLRSQLAEETNSVNQDQNQLKEIYENQIGQMEEKLLHYEKQCEKLEKDLAEVKDKSATAKEVYEHQLSEQELHLQSTNSELVRLKDNLSRITNNHKCEVSGMKKLHEIMTNELEESCLTLERTVSEQKRFINESAQKFNRQKNDLEQSYEIQLSDVEEKRRLGELEIFRLKKHLDEMKLDHEREMQSLEKSCEARLFELEDKYCGSTNELERLRKSLMCTTGSYSEERNALEMRVDELEILRRDLQNRNAALEDDIVLLRDQALHREDEMRDVLKNAAENQQEKTTEMMSEISQLQQQLLLCTKEHAEALAEVKREYEAQILDLQSRNSQLMERNCSLELMIEEDLSLHNERSTAEMVNLQRHITMPAHENTSPEKRLSPQKSPERSSGIPSNKKTVCPPYSHNYTFSDGLHSEEDNFGNCFSPADNDGPIIEGFVAEPSVTFSQRRASYPKSSKLYSTSTEKPDFVEEHCDEFQPEITVDGTGQDSDHPIHEVVFHERFEPETTDRFLLESAEIDSSIWQHELSVGMSPSHLQAQANLDFTMPDQLHEDEELESDVQRREDLSTDFNSNCSARDALSGSGNKPETSDERFEKHLNDVREELEEEYVIKMRRQQLQLTIEYETKQAEYKTEMEQHFAQRMKAVKYEWERKFNKALLKVKKEMEERHMSELRQLTSECDSMHQDTISPVEDEEQDLLPNIGDRSEELSEATDLALKGNHELPEASDVLHEEAAISQTKTDHSQVEHELQVILTNRESVSSASSTATTLTLNASPTAIDKDTEIDEADSSRSEVSETNSAKERFLEELEDISHQSCQDLPLEWELTSTIIESGNFEVEPEHLSVWEVFDGRCVRQDCQEVRHKFHKLYQWVVKHKGDGFDVVLDGELKMLMEIAGPQNDLSNLLKLPQVNHSEISSIHSCDGAANIGEISHADLLARVLSLESDKHKLEEKLLVQIHCNSNIRREMQQYEAMNGQLQGEVNARLSLEDEMFKLKNMQNKTNLSERSYSSSELDEEDSCDELVSHSDKNSTYQRNYSVSDTAEAVEDLQLLDNQDEHVSHSLDMAVHNLHMMLTDKEEQIVLLQQENENLKSYIDKFIIQTTLPGHDTERLGVLQQQLQFKQQLLEMKDTISRNLPAGPTSPQQTAIILADGSEDFTNQEEKLDLKLNMNTLNQVDVEPLNDTSTSILGEKQNMNESSAKHSIDRDSDGSRKEVSGCEISEFSCPQLHFTDVSADKEWESTASSTSDIHLDTSTFDGSHNVRSRSETPDLEDKDLAKEISRLHKDIQETKEIYCKENVLLHEALNKGAVRKNTTGHKQISYKDITARTSAHASEPLLVKTEDDTEMLKQKLDICLKQNHMLEDENAILRKRVRLQAAKIIIFKKSTSQDKSKESEEWQQSFSVQLAAIHKQRNDLIQLLSDMDAGKESTISESLQGTLKRENLRQVQEDLVARVEELDHLYKMLTQRQVELQHCEAERRHLEQLCLLKDETEMQLMKQKRLMEEQLSEIEYHLRERETILIEEKSQLLQELKEGNINHSWVLMKKHNLVEAPSSELLPQSCLDGSSLSPLATAIAVQHHSSPEEGNAPTSAINVAHQHLEAIETLRTKLKQEYRAHTSKISNTQTSAAASYQEGHNKQA